MARQTPYDFGSVHEEAPRCSTLPGKANRSVLQPGLNYVLDKSGCNESVLRVHLNFLVLTFRSAVQYELFHVSLKSLLG